MDATRRDLWLKIGAGLLVYAGIIGIAAWWGVPESRLGVVVVRVTLAAAVLVTAWQHTAPRVRAWWQAHRRRQTAQDASTPAPQGFRRIDAYVLTAAILAGLVYLAHSNRYDVTHYRDGRTLVFQRVDRFTGHAELWVAGGSSNTPRPAWVTFTTASQ